MPEVDGVQVPLVIYENLPEDGTPEAMRIVRAIGTILKDHYAGARQHFVDRAMFYATTPGRSMVSATCMALCAHGMYTDDRSEAGCRFWSQ